MRISKLFNQSGQIPLVIKTLANDVGSVSALGADVAQHLRAAKQWFSDPQSPPPDPNNQIFRSFALPIMDAFLQKTDPSFTPSPKGVNPSSEHVGWIARAYAQSAADSTPIKSEDLQKIYDEIEDFHRIRNVLKEKKIPTNLTDYKTYDDFTKIIRPFMSRKDKFRTIENAPDHVLDNASVLYSGKEGAIVVPHTYEASVYFGSKHWCISYDTTREHFDDYLKTSPMVMYLPNTYTMQKERAEDIISGKIAVVENTIYDENDEKIKTLPAYINNLHDAALNRAVASNAEYLKLFGNVVPAAKPKADASLENEEVTLSPDSPYFEYLNTLRLHDLAWETRIKAFFENHPNLSSNKSFILEALAQNGRMLEYADESLRKDKDVVLAAIKQNGVALEFADHEGLIDTYGPDTYKEIVLAAVTQDGRALKFADATLKKDKDVVLAAVTRNGWALIFANASLKKDREVVLAAITQDARTLQLADVSLKRDKEIVLAAVKQDGFALQYAEASLKKDKQVVLAAVTQDGFALQYADESLRKDKQIVLAAVTQYGFALKYADESLKKDKEFILDAVVKNGDVLRYIDQTLFHDTDFASHLLDIAANANIENRNKIIGHMHKIPAFFGHVTADIEALRARLDTYSAQNPTSEREFEPQEDLALA